MYENLFKSINTFFSLIQVIHTDSGLYGQPIATGTIDFWPNGL